MALPYTVSWLFAVGSGATLMLALVPDACFVSEPMAPVLVILLAQKELTGALELYIKLAPSYLPAVKQRHDRCMSAWGRRACDSDRAAGLRGGRDMHACALADNLTSP